MLSQRERTSLQTCTAHSASTYDTNMELITLVASLFWDAESELIMKKSQQVVDQNGSVLIAP